MAWMSHDRVLVAQNYQPSDGLGFIDFDVAILNLADGSVTSLPELKATPDGLVRSNFQMWLSADTAKGALLTGGHPDGFPALGVYDFPTRELSRLPTLLSVSVAIIYRRDPSSGQLTALKSIGSIRGRTAPFTRLAQTAPILPESPTFRRLESVSPPTFARLPTTPSTTSVTRHCSSATRWAVSPSRSTIVRRSVELVVDSAFPGDLRPPQLCPTPRLQNRRSSVRRIKPWT